MSNTAIASSLSSPVPVGRLLSSPGKSSISSPSPSARSAESVKFENGLTTPRPASAYNWHKRIHPGTLQVLSEMMSGESDCLYKVNEADAIIERHANGWTDDEAEGESSAEEILDEGDEWSMDEDMPWQYRMAPVLEAMADEVQRADNERSLLVRTTSAKPHAIVAFDEQGNASVRKSTIKFNPLIVVHGESSSTDSSPTIPYDIYNPEPANLSIGSFRHKLRDMETDDETWYQRTLNYNVRESQRPYPSPVQMSRIEVASYEKAIGQSDTIRLQAAADNILDDKVDWTAKRQMAFDAVRAQAQRDADHLAAAANLESVATPTWTDSISGTIKRLKRSRPAIPSFADLVAPMPHKSLC